MTRTVAKWLSVLDAVIVIIGTLICEARGNHGASVLIILAGAVASVVFTWFLRCPHCGAWPRRGSFFHEFCPYCGEMLDD